MFFKWGTACENAGQRNNKLTHEFRSLFFQTREASCPIILESKIRLWMRPWSPEIQNKQINPSECLQRWQILNKLLLTHSHSSDSGEMSSMSERKFCKNWVLLPERCRRLQYSLEKWREELTRANKEGENERAMKRLTLEPETRVRLIQRSWAATTAYL